MRVELVCGNHEYVELEQRHVCAREELAQLELDNVVLTEMLLRFRLLLSWIYTSM